MNLKTERLNRGLSQAEAAKAMGVEKHVLRSAETGSTPHPGNAFKIAEFYGYKVTEVWPLDEASAAA